MSRRKFSTLSETHEEPSINMTPLIDVVFVVLVMFIIIAPILNIDRIDLAQGAATVERSQIDQTIESLSHDRKLAFVWPYLMIKQMRDESQQRK